MSTVLARIGVVGVICVVAVVVLDAGLGWGLAKSVGNVAFVAAVSLIVAGLGAMFYLLLTGSARRAGEQIGSVGEFPSAPADPGATVLGPETGLYLGTTFAPSWQQRITVGDIGDRATCTMTASATGVLLERTGASDIWIPHDSITAVRTERGHAGKVMSSDGVLVIRWLLPSGVEVDTGIRGDDKTTYPAWVQAFRNDNDQPESDKGRE